MAAVTPWLASSLKNGTLLSPLIVLMTAASPPGAEALDLADDRLVVLMAERRVLLRDGRFRTCFFFVRYIAQDLVGRARVHIVGAEQVEPLLVAALGPIR